MTGNPGAKRARGSRVSATTSRYLDAIPSKKERSSAKARPVPARKAIRSPSRYPRAPRQTAAMATTILMVLETETATNPWFWKRKRQRRRNRSRGNLQVLTPLAPSCRTLCFILKTRPFGRVFFLGAITAVHDNSEAAIHCKLTPSSCWTCQIQGPVNTSNPGSDLAFGASRARIACHAAHVAQRAA